MMAKGQDISKIDAAFPLGKAPRGLPMI